MSAESTSGTPIDLRPCLSEHLPMFQSWFQDEELSQWVERPSQRYLDYVATTPRQYACVAYEGDVAVGFIVFGLEDEEPASFMFFVRPDLRHQGYGKRILATALVAPEVADIDVWEAGVEPDNVASRRCLEAIGFTDQGRDPEWSDYLRYVYERSSGRRTWDCRHQLDDPVSSPGG